MNKPAETLIDLLKRIRLPILAELADDAKLIQIAGKEDLTSTAKLQKHAKDMSEQISNGHKAILQAFATWKQGASKAGLAHDSDSAAKLLQKIQAIATQMALVEGRFNQLTTHLTGVEQSSDTDRARDHFSLALTARISWLESADEFANLLKDFAERENATPNALNGSTFEGMLDPSRFTDIQPFRSGGVCTLETAYDTKTKRRVVLKTFKDYLPARTDDADKFRRAEELFIDNLSKTARVAIPGAEKTIGFFLKFYEHGLAKPVLVTELIEGETLQAVRERGIVSQEFIMEVLEGVGPIVQNLIDKGVFHDDLSPENIMVRPKGSETAFAVIDFHKISLFHGSQSVLRNLYAPYEHLIMEQTDATTPFFELARISLALLLPETKYKTIVHNTLNSQLILAEQDEELAKKLNKKLVLTLEKALQPNPEDRYHNWEDMHRDLLHAKTGEPSRLKKWANALKILLTDTGKIKAFRGALRGNANVTQRPMVTKLIPTEHNATGISLQDGYFIINIDDDTQILLQEEQTDRGKSRTQDDWVTYFQNHGGGTRLYTPAELLLIVVALQKRLSVSKDAKEIKTCNVLKALLVKDLGNDWMMTGARILYTETGKDTVILNFRNKEEKHEVKKFWGPHGWLTKLGNDGNVIAQSLFQANKEEVNSAFKFLTERDSYVWRLNGATDEQRPVVLGLDDDDGFGIYADVGGGGYGPARGVAVRKKI
jgi:hypothetical protein